MILFWLHCWYCTCDELSNNLRPFVYFLCGWCFDRKYGLDDNTVDFIGHALALHRDDRYLDEPALETVKRMKVNTSQLIFVSLDFKFAYITSFIFSWTWVLPLVFVLAICGVSCTFSRRITIHISIIWIRRASPGLFLSI